MDIWVDDILSLALSFSDFSLTKHKPSPPPYTIMSFGIASRASPDYGVMSLDLEVVSSSSGRRSIMPLFIFAAVHKIRSGWGWILFGWKVWSLFVDAPPLRAEVGG